MDDPEGAITAARTLLETVCKHILDERGVDYEADADLPALRASPEPVCPTPAATIGSWVAVVGSYQRRQPE